MSDDKCIANYLRLSLEDDDIMDESNSITNQRIALGQYINGSREFDGMEVLEFKDDGYSGTNFDGPGFQEMMSLAGRGKIYGRQGTLWIFKTSRGCDKPGCKSPDSAGCEKNI